MKQNEALEIVGYTLTGAFLGWLLGRLFPHVKWDGQIGGATPFYPIAWNNIAVFIVSFILMVSGKRLLFYVGLGMLVHETLQEFSEHVEGLRPNYWNPFPVGGTKTEA